MIVFHALPVGEGKSAKTRQNNANNGSFSLIVTWKKKENPAAVIIQYSWSNPCCYGRLSHANNSKGDQCETDRQSWRPIVLLLHLIQDSFDDFPTPTTIKPGNEPMT